MTTRLLGLHLSVSRNLRTTKLTKKPGTLQQANKVTKLFKRHAAMELGASHKLLPNQTYFLQPEELAPIGHLKECRFKVLT